MYTLFYPFCRDLELAKKRAAESYQELAGLRQCLDESIRESVAFAPSSQPTRPAVSAASTSSATEMDDAHLDVSMAQVDQLMNQFQESFTGFGATANIESTGRPELSFSRMSQSANMDDSSAFDAFLERYSDKLVDMVGEKLISKMNAKR